MLSGKTDLIIGCRTICRLCRHGSDPYGPLFIPIVGFESETDTYPVGEERDLCGKRYLKELDKKFAKYVEKCRPWVLETCERIIEALEGWEE